METVQEREFGVEPCTDEDACVQSCGYLIELSQDWIVCRASENVHRLLGESHVTLIDEPLGRFVHSDALHDLRNLFSRLSGTGRIARAFRVRLTEDPRPFDIAFQLEGDRVILEAVPSPEEGFGEAFSSVGPLVGGLSESTGQALLDGAARRMRALTGFDRVTLTCGASRAESSRGILAGPSTASKSLPPMIADVEADPVPAFPRGEADSAASLALLRAPDAKDSDQLRASGIRAVLRVPFTHDGQAGEFLCENRRAVAPSLELHAAAELFAQLFTMQLEIERLKKG